MVAFRSLLSSFVLPIFFLQSVQAAGLFDFEGSVSNHSLARRAVPLVGAGACLNLDLTVKTSLGVTIPIANGVCICIQGGAITPASLVRIQQSISANQNSLLGPVINGLGGVVDAAVVIGDALIPQFAAAFPRDCPYPANSVANDCGGCAYVCQTGFTLSNGLCCATGTTESNGVCCASGQTGCNGQCVPSGTLCCATGTTPSNGVCCPPSQFGCNGGCLDDGSLCCAAGSTATNGVCCPAGQSGCNGQCIPSGDLCCATGTQACLGQCLPSNILCCALGQQACNGQCIASSVLCCATNFFACGTQCVATGTICQSGIVIPPIINNRRSLNAANCPVGHEACRIPQSPRSKNLGSAFECINTASDLESCGGCMDPILGRPQGQDCSAIPDVDSATCQAGRCVIESCARGFASNGTACIKTESTGRKLSGYWAALHEASHIILQD